MGNQVELVNSATAEDAEFLSVFHIENSGAMTLLTPRKECLPDILEQWQSGEFDFGRFLRKLMKLHKLGECSKWLRLMDYKGGYADYYLFSENLYAIFYNRLHWGLKHLAFTISGYCVLRLQLEGKMHEQLAGEAINTMQNGTFFHGDLSADYSLKPEDETRTSHVSIVFNKTLLKDEFKLDEQVIYRCQQNPDVTLSIYPFPVTSNIHATANRILHLDPNQPMPLLQAESGVMEILSQCFVQLHNTDNNLEGMQLRDSDIAALKQVHQLLETDYASEITLASLSQKVGLNRKKLNLGFQLLFGSTVGEYLTSKRMAVAVGLLQQGHTTTVVALEVGYNNRSAFSDAFKRHYGCSPKQYLSG